MRDSAHVIGIVHRPTTKEKAVVVNVDLRGSV